MPMSLEPHHLEKKKKKKNYLVPWRDHSENWGNWHSLNQSKLSCQKVRI